MKPTFSFRLRRLLLAGFAASTLAVPQTAQAQATLPPNASLEDVDRALQSAQEKFARGNQRCDPAQISDAILEAESLEPVASELEQLSGSTRARRLRERIESFLTFARSMKAFYERQIAAQCPQEVRTPGELEARFAAAEQDFARARQACDRDAMTNALDRMSFVIVRTGSLNFEAINGGNYTEADRWSEQAQNFRRREGTARAQYYNCGSPPPRPAPGEPDVPGLYDDEPEGLPSPPRRSRLSGGWQFAVRADASLFTESDVAFAMVGGGLSLMNRNIAYQLASQPLGSSSGGFGFELDASLGVSKERNEAGGFRDSFGIKWAVIPYAVVAVPVADNVELFARAGYGAARFNFELRGPGVDIDQSNTDWFFAFGAGAQVNFDGRNGVRASYTRWDDFNRGGISANVFSLSYERRFGGRR